MITVWGRDNSTNVKKVRWCLEELELPYHTIPAGGKFGLINEPEYLAMNPNGLIPCLRDDETGITLWESNTIVRYLAARYGQNRIWFDEPVVRAQGEKWMDWAASMLSPLHRVVLFGLVRTPPEQRNMPQIEEAVVQCDKLLGILDNELAHLPWLSGAQFGPGDIAVAPYIYNLLNIDITLTPRPHLQRWYQQLNQRAAFRHTVAIPVS